VSPTINLLYLCFWEGFMLRTHGVRRNGSAALDPRVGRLRPGGCILGIWLEAWGRRCGLPVS
jgi:hypothetical protein